MLVHVLLSYTLNSMVALDSLFLGGLAAYSENRAVHLECWIYLVVCCISLLHHLQIKGHVAVVSWTQVVSLQLE